MERRLEKPQPDFRRIHMKADSIYIKEVHEGMDVAGVRYPLVEAVYIQRPSRLSGEMIAIFLMAREGRRRENNR